MKGLHLSCIELFTSTCIWSFRGQQSVIWWWLLENQSKSLSSNMVSHVIVCISIDLKYHSSKNMPLCKSSGLHVYAIELCHTKTCASVGLINLISKHILLITRYPILLPTDFPINMLTNLKKGKKIDSCTCANREFSFYFLKRTLRLFELHINSAALYMWWILHTCLMIFFLIYSWIECVWKSNL